MRVAYLRTGAPHSIVQALVVASHPERDPERGLLQLRFGAGTGHVDPMRISRTLPGWPLRNSLVPGSPSHRRENGDGRVGPPQGQDRTLERRTGPRTLGGRAPSWCAGRPLGPIDAIAGRRGASVSLPRASGMPAVSNEDASTRDGSNYQCPDGTVHPARYHQHGRRD